MTLALFRATATVALALLCHPSASYAVPSAQSPVAEADTRTAYMPFDPPLNMPLRYRWESIASKDGETDIEWDISSYTFEQTDQGFSLTVRPVDSGSNETDPEILAIEEKLNDLMAKPFVLKLSPDGEIVSLNDADLYWSAIFKAMEDVLGETGANGKPFRAKEREFLTSFLSILRKMPAETRLSLMTESVQPALEFAQTEVKMGEPLTGKIDAGSIFGGTVERDVRIGLDRLEPDSAFLTIHSILSPESLQQLTRTAMDRIAEAADDSLDAAARKEIEEATSGMNFQHETVSSYRVSTITGLTDDFQSTETIDVDAAGKASRRITSRSLKRFD